MSDHRWSGWPGAWCLDCGIEDQTELCLAVHDFPLECVKGHPLCLDHEPKICPEHVNPPCPEPGSRKHDPYAKAQTT